MSNREGLATLSCDAMLRFRKFGVCVPSAFFLAAAVRQGLP